MPMKNHPVRVAYTIPRGCGLVHGMGMSRAVYRVGSMPLFSRTLRVRENAAAKP
jgi:hypothetical protein